MLQLAKRDGVELGLALQECRDCGAVKADNRRTARKLRCQMARHI